MVTTAGICSHNHNLIKSVGNCTYQVYESGGGPKQANKQLKCFPILSVMSSASPVIGQSCGVMCSEAARWC